MREWKKIQSRIEAMGDASPIDYCTQCGDSPESAAHVFDHDYKFPYKRPTPEEAAKFAAYYTKRLARKNLTLLRYLETYWRHVPCDRCGQWAQKHLLPSGLCMSWRPGSWGRRFKYGARTWAELKKDLVRARSNDE